jgi:hypothetical protein
MVKVSALQANNQQILLVACLTHLLDLLSPDFSLPLIGLLGQYFFQPLCP